MSGNPLVSLVVPVYNAGDYLNVCVNSLVCQTYTNLQIILVDDGSTDGSAGICDEWCSKDDRITVIHQNNKGVSAARNVGIDTAQGQWLEFVDSDDWLEPGAVEESLDLAQRSHAQLVIFNYRTVSDDDTPDTVHDVPSDYRIRNGVLSLEKTLDYLLAYFGVKGYVWNKFFSRALIEQQGLRFDSKIRMCEDLLFNVEYALAATTTVSTNQCLYNYRNNPNSVSHLVDLGSVSTCLEAHERMMSIVPVSSLPLVQASYAILAEELLFRTYDAGDTTHRSEYQTILRRYWWQALKRQHSLRYWTRILGGAFCPSLFYPAWNRLKARRMHRA